MTLVLAVVLVVGLALFASLVIAGLATVILGGVIGALGAPIAGLNALLRSRHASHQAAVERADPLRQPPPVQAQSAHSNDAASSGWLKPVFTVVVFGIVTFLLDGPRPTRQRRRGGLAK